MLMGTAPAAAAGRLPQLPALTGLRFFAAMAVVCCHFATLALPPGIFHDLAQSGAIGVSLFFVLSGFILTYTYVGRGGAFVGTVRAFYAARVARVIPVYLLGMAIALGPLLWLPLGPYTVHPSLLTLFATGLTLTQAWFPYMHTVWNAPSWSLSAEAFFYALFPFFVLPLACLTRDALRVLLACLCLLAVAVPFVFLGVNPDQGATKAYGYWQDFVQFNPVMRVPEFLIGATLGRLFALRDLATTGGYSPRSGRRLLLTVALIVAIMGIGPSIPAVFTHTIAPAPLFAVLIWTLVTSPGRVSYALASPQLVLLGEASYTLYMLHYPLHDWMDHVLHPLDTALAGFALYAAATVFISILIFRFYEDPARRIVKRALS